MRWATRRGVHVDRAACAWLLRRFVDTDAMFVFVDDPEDVPADATPFRLDDPVLWEASQIVHEADLVDERDPA